MNRPTNPRRFFTPFALGACILAAPAVAAPAATIADIAPASSALIWSIDNYTQMRASFDRTGFLEVWRDPAIQAWIKKHTQEMVEEINEGLSKIDTRLEDLQPPEGPIGGAFWLAPAADADSEPLGHFITLIDFGANADETEKIIAAALEKGERDKTLLVDEEGFGGTTIFKITDLSKAADEEDAADAEGEDDEFEDWDMGDESDSPFDHIKTFFYARAGTNFLVASDQDRMERAIDRVIGGKDQPSIGDSPDFATALAQIGPQQGYAVFFPQPLIELVVENDRAMRADMEPDMLAMMGPSPSDLMRLFGLSEVRAVAGGVRFDTDLGLMEQAYSVLVPTKKGIFTLMDPPAVPFKAPAFASADAAGVTMLQFEFADLLGMLSNVANEFQGEMGEQIKQQLEMASATAGPVLSNLGPQVYIVTNYNKPLNAQSQQILVAINARDTNALTQTITGFAPMAGLQARDFQGNQIWSMPADAMTPIPGMGQFALAIGFNHLFVGSVPAVENALRMAATPDGLSLGKDERFQRGMAALPGSGLAFGWSDTRRTLEFQEWSLRNMDKIQAAQIEQMFGDDPESQEAKQMYLEQLKDSIPEFVRDMPSFDVLYKILGDSALEFHSTPEGFKGRSILLRPAK